MKEVWKVEARRVFKLTSVWAAMVIIIALSVFLLCYGIHIQKTVKIEGDVAYRVSGFEAIQLRKEYDQALVGEVKEEELVKAIKIWQESYDTETDHINYSNEFLQYEPLADMVGVTVLTMPSYNEDNIQNMMQISAELTANYYQFRTGKISSLLNGIMKEGSKKQKAVELNQNVITPFIYQPNTFAWDSQVGYLSILTTAVLLLSVFFASSIFSEAYENGMDCLIRTSHYGDKHIVMVRLSLVAIVTFLLYLTGHVILLAGSAFILGADGLEASYQIANPFCILNLTIGKAALIQLVIGLLVCLSGALLTAAVSAASNKAVQTLAIAVLSFVLYTILWHFLSQSIPWIGTILSFMPTYGLNVLDTLMDESCILSVFGHPMFSFVVSAVSACFWIAIAPLLTQHFYRSHQR